MPHNASEGSHGEGAAQHVPHTHPEDEVARLVEAGARGDDFGHELREGGQGEVLGQVGLDLCE